MKSTFYYGQLNLSSCMIELTMYVVLRGIINIGSIYSSSWLALNCIVGAAAVGAAAAA